MQLAVTRLPRDFLLDGISYTPNQLSQRMRIGEGIRIFDKTPPNISHDSVTGREVVKYITALPEVSDINADYKNRLNDLRKCILDMWHIRLPALWIDRFLILAPQYVGEVRRFRDFLRVYRDMKKMTNEFRGLVHEVQHTMITKQAMLTCEDDILKKLGAEYLDRTVTKDTLPTQRDSGFVLKIGQRMKQANFCDQIRKTGFKNHHEVVYERERGVGDEKGKQKAMAGVIKVFHVTFKQYGFDGWLGVGPGHYTMLNMNKEGSKLSLPGTEGLLSWLEDKAKSEGLVNLATVLEDWKSEPSKNTASAMITVGSGETTASPLTDADADTDATVSCVTQLRFLCCVTQLRFLC